MHIFCIALQHIELFQVFQRRPEKDYRSCVCVCACVVVLQRGADWFYHRGMDAGENTLEGIITRLITRSITDNKVSAGVGASMVMGGWYEYTPKKHGNVPGHHRHTHPFEHNIRLCVSA